MDSRNDESLPDLEWDAAYFAFILELSEKNASRYEEQADQLLKNKTLHLSVNGIPVKYRLDRIGCWCEAADLENTFQKRSWNRFGWGKSAKRRALPGFFAKTEADLLFPDVL